MTPVKLRAECHMGGDDKVEKIVSDLEAHKEELSKEIDRSCEEDGLKFPTAAPESERLEVPGEILKWVNEHREVQSLLYNLNVLPECITTELQRTLLIGIYAGWEAHVQVMEWEKEKAESEKEKGL